MSDQQPQGMSVDPQAYIFALQDEIDEMRKRIIDEKARRIQAETAVGVLLAKVEEYEKSLDLGGEPAPVDLDTPPEPTVHLTKEGAEQFIEALEDTPVGEALANDRTPSTAELQDPATQAAIAHARAQVGESLPPRPEDMADEVPLGAGVDDQTKINRDDS